MTSSLDLIALNNRLLAVYSRIINNPAISSDEDLLRDVLSIRNTFLPNTTPDLEATFNRYLRLIALHMSPQAQTRIAALLSAPVVKATPALPRAFAGHGAQLGPLAAEGVPGISVVTCSMNRTQNLIKAIPSWLANHEIAEIVVVDWSSRIHVAQEFASAGIVDPRIRILRVENEPRWILTYAFNAGFRAASFDTILKVDADIVLSPDFFQRNHVAAGSFIAGNWQTSADDQAHVNGFFFVSRKALQQVGGFNEHITSYGWDDAEIYERMTLSGLRRCDVAAGTIFHLGHDDVARIGDRLGSVADQTVEDDLTSGTMFMIRRNRYLAMIMPAWSQSALHLPFKVLARSEAMLTIQRDGWEPSAIPNHIQAAGRLHALTELLAWRLSRRVLQLDPARIPLLLARSNAALSRIDTEVALAAPEHVIKGKGHYLVLDLTEDLLSGSRPAQSLAQAFSALINIARIRGLTPVLRAPYTALPHNAPHCLSKIPLIPSWEPLGQVPRLTVASLFGGKPPDGRDFGVDITTGVLNDLALSMPEIVVARARLFIDVQHGLGNRLRALASAAAIASGSDRELVVVWEPDHHCEGRLTDLFEYQGAVISQRFLADATERGCDVYNYMPHEAGGKKDVPIGHDSRKDIYARSAFVLQNPHSTWETENHFLRSLTPIASIRALVASVRNPNDLSAHVRMEGGRKSEHLAYESAANWQPDDHALIDEWRNKSHFSRFLTRIDMLIAKGEADRIFLAADMPETYTELLQRYGKRLAWLPRALYDRSAVQLHYALADAILLSRSPLLLGSTWSSFSELALRLAPEAIKVEMSGKDF
ncbi:MAG: galactosyltransferase-related protein [Alphaproteobacteria bacterium]